MLVRPPLFTENVGATSWSRSNRPVPRRGSYFFCGRHGPLMGADKQPMLLSYRENGPLSYFDPFVGRPTVAASGRQGRRPYSRPIQGRHLLWLPISGIIKSDWSKVKFNWRERSPEGALYEICSQISFPQKRTRGISPRVRDEAQPEKVEVRS
jgi:hypothetical protein